MIRRRDLIPTRARRTILLFVAGFSVAAAQAAPSGAIRTTPITDMTATATQAAAVPPGRLIRVPEDIATPRAAIDAAQPGDVILLAAGSYDGGLIVPPEKHDITIRGADEARVVFDGKGFSLTAIEINADDVTLENLSAHDFDGNGFYWEKVAGFTGRYLRVWNVNLYGIYATQSKGGVVEHSLVSGAADAGFYIGECQPCDTTVRNVEARLSAIGYSGTNTGAGMQLLDSTWDRNGTGIMPNSYEDQALEPPESGSQIAGNIVRDSGTVPVPAHTPLAGFIGMGIGIAGGNDNMITGNSISGSASYGIALFPTLQPSRTVIAPKGNQVKGNMVAGSAKADLAVSTGVGTGNCFADNRFTTSLPATIEDVQPCNGGTGSVQGDASVGRELAIPVPDALDRLAAAGARPDYRTMPSPEALPGSPDPLPAGLRSFRSETTGPIAPAGLAIVVSAGTIVMIIARRRRRTRSAREAH
jgi:hypothetical protein